MEHAIKPYVAITGSSGFIGSCLKGYLQRLGYGIREVSRSSSPSDGYYWDPDSGYIDVEALEGTKAVIHLAGENIAVGRWTASRREAILQSRILGTRTLVDGLRKTRERPAVLISTSGVNYYGGGNGLVDESASAGQGFLSGVCQEWEREARRASEWGVRTVLLRTGVVLHPDGGVLQRLLPVYRWGLGGRIASGRQGFPWISMSDLVRVYPFLMKHTDIAGPVNAVHPHRVDQDTFNQVLAGVLHRPAIFPLPAFLVYLFFGQMGVETLLGDLQVRPSVLLEEGFTFQHASLKAALSAIIGQTQ